MQRVAVLVLSWLLLISRLAIAQEYRTIRVGDSSAVAEIDSQTRIIYDSTQSWVFAFTRSNLLDHPRAYGTEAQGGMRDGRIVRIIAGGWSPEGHFGAEYYLVKGELVFVYESVGWFQEIPGGGWRNFKGIRGWERRIYVKGGKAVYVETTGDGAPPVAVEQLQSNVRRLLAELARSRNRVGDAFAVCSRRLRISS